MTKPFAPLAARLSMAFRVFSPSGTAILMTSKPKSFPALSANFHSVWNHGSSGCFTRKPNLRFSAIADCDITAARPMAASALVNLCMVNSSFNSLSCREKSELTFLSASKQGIRKIASPTAVVRVVIPGNYFSIREHYHIAELQ